MPNTLTEWLAVWVILAVLASPFIGSLLHKRRVRINRQRCARLEKLVDLADEYDAAPTDKERQRIFRKATDLGFTDDSRPFLCDENEQPHLPRAS